MSQNPFAHWVFGGFAGDHRVGDSDANVGSLQHVTSPFIACSPNRITVTDAGLGAEAAESIRFLNHCNRLPIGRGRSCPRGR